MKAQKPFERRQTEDTPSHSYWDARQQMHIIPVNLGKWHVTSHPDELLVTVLGSCICACIRDPITAVGGMNHFLLPRPHLHDAHSALRYGAFAMEKLINEIVKSGGERSRLEVKLFGGAAILSTSPPIGDMNVEFAREYIRREKLVLLNESVGGTHPRRVHFTPATGKVMMRSLRRQNDYKVAQEESRYSEHINHSQVSGQVHLF